MDWDDIPYVPLNELRWKAPREIIKPNQTISKDGNYCGGRTRNDVGTEDCLYLDI